MISQEEFCKIKPGMSVQIVSRWNQNTCQNTYGRMDRYLGRIVTVSFISKQKGYIGIIQDEDDDLTNWSWNRFCIDRIIYPTERNRDYSIVNINQGGLYG